MEVSSEGISMQPFSACHIICVTTMSVAGALVESILSAVLGERAHHLTPTSIDLLSLPLTHTLRPPSLPAAVPLFFSFMQAALMGARVEPLLA